MVISQTVQNQTVILQPKGRVDTSTSPDLQKAVLGAFQSSKHVVIDFEQVPYISSAGLRVLLIGQKTAASKGGEFRLTHVPPAIMTIFDTVGFSAVLTID